MLPLFPYSYKIFFDGLYSGVIASWVSEARYFRKSRRKKVRKNLVGDEKGRTFALAFRGQRRRHASRGAEEVKEC